MTTASPRYIAASNLRAEMARQNKRKGELARLLGVSLSAVTRRIQGQTALDVDELYRVAEWLGVSVGTLLPDPTSRGTTAGYWVGSECLEPLLVAA